MTQFLYALAEQGSLQQCLERHGITRRAEADEDWKRIGATVGVTGEGVLVAPQQKTEQRRVLIVGLGDRVGFDATTQTWEQVTQEDVEPYWIGYETDSRPGPDDLARPTQYNGHPVKLEDGNEWLVPVARMFPIGTALPTRLRLGADGEVVQKIKPEYMSLFERAQGWAEQIYSPPEDGDEDAEPQAGMEWSAAFTLGTDALNVNYRVGLAEVNALGLFGSDSLLGVLQALVDLPTALKRGREMVAEQEGKKGGSPQTE